MLSFRPFMQNNKWMRNLKLLGIPEVSLKYVKEKKKRRKKERKIGSWKIFIQTLPTAQTCIYHENYSVFTLLSTYRAIHQDLSSLLTSHSPDQRRSVYNSVFVEARTFTLLSFFWQVARVIPSLKRRFASKSPHCVSHFWSAVWKIIFQGSSNASNQYQPMSLELSLKHIQSSSRVCNSLMLATDPFNCPPPEGHPTSEITIFTGTDSHLLLSARTCSCKNW